MRLHEIENWALDIIERVRQKQPVEDDRVELKRIWPTDKRKAARRIAGHANSAHGEPILWLIGVDEAKGLISGVEFVELASWYRTVEASFDELTPRLKSLNIPVDGKTVAALYFETDRAPYVVKVAEGGSVQREVPWREATGIRTATRSQLLKLLSPLQKQPLFEVVGCVLRTGKPWSSTEGKKFLPWNIFIAIFITQPSQQELVIPSHRSSISFTISDFGTFGPFKSSVEFRGVGWSNVNATKTGVTINGSGFFEIRCDLNLERKTGTEDNFSKDAQVDLVLVPSNIGNPIEISIPMKSILATNKNEGRWKSGSYDEFRGR